MTDNEIIKALECCTKYEKDENVSCKKRGCPFRKKCKKDINALEKAALDLINRQKAEIERLENNFQRFLEDDLREAIKELAVRFKEKATMISKGRLNPTKPMGYELDMEYRISMWDFDDLVKEMMGDAK